MNSLTVWAAILSLPVLLAGCASTPAVRSLASGTGQYVQSLQDGTSDVIAAQNRLNRLNEQRLTSLELASERARTGVRQQQLVWSADGSAGALAAYARATAPSAEMIVSGLRISAVSPAQVGMPAAAGYQKTIKALAEVRTKPKSFDTLMELLVFGQAVKAKYDELQKEVASDTDKAADAAPAVPK